MARPYWQARNDAEVTTTSATVWSDTASLTFTPANGSKRHLIIVSGVHSGGSASTSIDLRLYDNTAGAIVDDVWRRESGDTSPLEYEAWKQYILWTSPATPVSQNFILQFKSNSGTSTTRRVKQAGIQIIELDDADYAQESLARSTTTANTWPGRATKQTLSFNPASTGDYLILQSNIWDLSVADQSTLTALGLDGAYMINAATPVTAATNQDTRDKNANTWLWKKSITTGSAHNITSEFLVAIGVSATAGIAYDRLFALRLDLFAGDTYAEDNTKTSNTNSTYDTALSVAPTASSSADYLYLSDSIVEFNSTTVSMKGRIQKDSVTIFGETASEMGGSGYGTQTGAGYTYTGDGTTDTWNIDMQTESGTTAHFFYGAMILIQLSAAPPAGPVLATNPLPLLGVGRKAA